MKEIIVIGAGPAGIFAALASKNENTKVTILERNSKIGRKLAITGKGRCNITNDRDISDFFQEFNRNKNFCYSSLYSFDNRMLMNYFENKGLKLKSERGGRVFPKSDRSFDVIDTLRNDLKKNNIIIETGQIVEAVEKNEDFTIKTQDKIYHSDSLIIATGGVSYPTTGSDGIGYKLAKSLGHNVTPLRPSLVPIELSDNFTKDLEGISLKNIELNVSYNKKIIANEFGDLLFTKSGISGPTVLRASCFMDQTKDYDVSIDLKPALTENELDQRIQKDFNKYSNKDFKNSLSDLTINALIPIIINQSGIDENKKVHQITKEERMSLVRTFKEFKLSYKKLKDVEYGIITRGGVSVDEINPSTMESKLIDELYFAGEIIDVDANTGGFNLQFAFSSGYLAGKSCGGAN